ncbi:MAG: 30S ribosomal protein S16 [Patescibacteria group bacterium]
MVIIRLARIGKKKQAFFRLIVSEKSKDTKGTYLEALGSLNPHTDPPQVNLKTDRINYWLGQGAATSARVHNLLIDHKVISGEKVKVWKAKKRPVEEVKKEPTPETKTVAKTEVTEVKTASQPLPATAEAQPKEESQKIKRLDSTL